MLERTEYVTNLTAQYPDVDIPYVEERATRFCKSLLNRNWFVDARAMVSSEGGWPSFVYTAIIEALVAESIDVGFQNYTRRLSELYGNGRNENQVILYDGVIPFEGGVSNLDYITSQRNDGEPAAPFGGADSPSASIVGSIKRMKDSWAMEKRHGGRPRELNEREVDLLDTYASVGDMQEACTLVGMTHDQGRQVLRRVRRLAQHLDPRSLLQV